LVQRKSLLIMVFIRSNSGRFRFLHQPLAAQEGSRGADCSGTEPGCAAGRIATGTGIRQLGDRCRCRFCGWCDGRSRVARYSGFGDRCLRCWRVDRIADTFEANFTLVTTTIRVLVFDAAFDIGADAAATDSSAALAVIGALTAAFNTDRDCTDEIDALEPLVAAVGGALAAATFALGTANRLRELTSTSDTEGAFITTGRRWQPSRTNAIRDNTGLTDLGTDDFANTLDTNRSAAAINCGNRYA